MRGKLVRALLTRPAVFFHPHHVRNDLPRLLDHHPVPQPHAQPFQLVPIVQAGPRDGRPGNLDRFEVRDGSEGAGFPHLHLNLVHLAHPLVFFELECDDPARRPRGRSQPVSLTQAVDLDHKPIDFAVQRGNLLQQLMAVLNG